VSTDPAGVVAPAGRLGKRGGGRQRLYLRSFAALFGLGLGGGFYYYLVPHGLNWGAAQVMLVLHIVGGALAFGVLVPFVTAHHRYHEGRARFLLAPWRAWRRRDAETLPLNPQRLVGHALHWSIILLLASGVFVAVPGVLFSADVVWLPDYRSYQVGNAIHLGSTFAAAGLMLVHWLRRRRPRTGRDGS